MKKIKEKMAGAYKEYDYAFNLDVAAISTWCDWNGLDMYKFNRDGDVWTDGTIKIKMYTFKDIDMPYVVGMNSKKGESNIDQNGVFFDSMFNQIYLHTDRQVERLTEQINDRIEFEKEWAEYKKLDLSTLGERFPVGESVYWYFLDCMPPIYVKGGFAMSEPQNHVNGKPTYYVFRGNEGSRTIEVNFAK